MCERLLTVSVNVRLYVTLSYVKLQYKLMFVRVHGSAAYGADNTVFLLGGEGGYFIMSRLVID